VGHPVAFAEFNLIKTVSYEVNSVSTRPTNSHNRINDLNHTVSLSLKSTPESIGRKFESGEIAAPKHSLRVIKADALGIGSDQRVTGPLLTPPRRSGQGGVLMIRFFGSHEEYDRIDAETV
jgi:hypothetical protein